MKRVHVGALISARCLELSCRLDHWFNFLVKAIKTVATQNYEVLANVTQNNVSIVWKCHRTAQIGGGGGGGGGGGVERGGFS